MKYLLLVILLPLLVSCTDEPRSLRVLKEAGYSNVTLMGYAWWACSDSDTYSTSFTAKGPTGVPTQGAVCCGNMKSCTIRTE